MEEIANILNEIAQLLDICSYTDYKKKDSLRAWATNLLTPFSDRDQRETLLAIQKVIAGMNSLSDIRLHPPKNSTISLSAANQQLQKMVAELDRLVRHELNI